MLCKALQGGSVSMRREILKRILDMAKKSTFRRTLQGSPPDHVEKLMEPNTTEQDL